MEEGHSDDVSGISLKFCLLDFQQFVKDMIQ